MHLKYIELNERIYTQMVVYVVSFYIFENTNLHRTENRLVVPRGLGEGQLEVSTSEEPGLLTGK